MMLHIASTQTNTFASSSIFIICLTQIKPSPKAMWSAKPILKLIGTQVMSLRKRQQPPSLRGRTPLPGPPAHTRPRKSKRSLISSLSKPLFPYRTNIVKNTLTCFWPGNMPLARMTLILVTPDSSNMKFTLECSLVTEFRGLSENTPAGQCSPMVQTMKYLVC